MNLKVSIITTTFNNRETIEASIASVISQTYENIEYIIIDGASTDGTKELIHKKYKDHIKVFISEPDNGMYYALNKGIKAATGDIIGFLHADDFYAANDIIAKVAQKFDSKNCEAVYGDLQYVNRENPEKILRYWISGEYHIDKLKKGWMPPHPSLFIRKKLYTQYGGFDTSFKVAADYELMTRFLQIYKMTACYIPEVFIKMRWGGKSNKNIKNILIKSFDDYRAIRKNKVGNLMTLFHKNFSKIGQFFQK